MTSVRKKSISWLCIFALVISLVGVLPAKEAYGYSFTPVVVNGECENGHVDGGAAYYSFELQQNGLALVDVSSSGDVDFELSKDAFLETQLLWTAGDMLNCHWVITISRLKDRETFPWQSASAL